MSYLVRDCPVSYIACECGRPVLHLQPLQCSETDYNKALWSPSVKLRTTDTRSLQEDHGSIFYSENIKPFG